MEAALTLVINKLSDLLENKIGLIAGAEDVIGSLREELLLLTIFLNGIYDQNDGTTDLVQELMHQLRRVSLKAEDVVDHYMVDVARHERKKSLKKVFTGCAMLSKKGKLAAQAKDIKLVIDGILRNKEKYRVRQDNGSPSDRVVQQIEENTLDWRRRNVEEEDVVGFDQQTCEECPSNLEVTRKGIVSKCKGLPLAIIVLGSLLSATEVKPSFKYWWKILNDTSWHPDSNNDCSKILSLSYRNLPPDLKACFLYVGVFPEDFEILARELCLLWVAEGFVKGRNTESEEDVAQEYLIGLADRNLIMISKRKSDGSIKSCHIHDLLRDLCMNEAQRCHLYKVHMDGASQNFKEGIRRLVLHKSDSRSRTLLDEGLGTLFDRSFNELSNMCSVFEDLYYMRVLHLKFFEDCCRLKLAKNMFLLRYLKIVKYQFLASKFVIRTRDISNLSNLQVLNLTSDVTIHLPKGIWKLKLLRHVYVRKLCAMPDAGSSNDSLPHLQTLSCIKYEKHTAKMLSSERFPNLRKLRMLSSDEQCNNRWRTESLKSLPELLHLASFKIR